MTYFGNDCIGSIYIDQWMQFTKICFKNICRLYFNGVKTFPSLWIYVNGCSSKGTTIWFWGGGGCLHFWSGQIIYFHHVLSRKIYFQVNRGQNIYFQPQQILKKAKQKLEKKGWGVVRGFSRGGRTWLSMFCITFCRLLARNIAI